MHLAKSRNIVTLQNFCALSQGVRSTKRQEGLEGRLEPGAQIVLVACASAHRQAAFDACNFLIDWLKTEAPFWKLEETDAGEAWVDSRASDDAAAARWEIKPERAAE